MKKLFRGIRLIGYFFLFIAFFLLAFASIKSIHAQDTPEIPGPELEDASFIPVGDLKIGDWVFVRGDKGDFMPEQITGLEYHQEEVEVYNLSVDGDETFFANDFAVHNKPAIHPHLCEIYVTDLDQALTEDWTFGNTGSYPGNFKDLFAITRDNCCQDQCICAFGYTSNSTCHQDPAKRPWWSCLNSYPNTTCSVDDPSSNQSIKMWTVRDGREYDCDCWDEITATAPPGWLVEDVEFDLYLSVGCDGKGKSMFQVARRMEGEVLAEWEVCIRSGDCTSGVQTINPHARVNLNPATKKFRFRARTSGSVASGHPATGIAYITNIKLHMIQTGEVNSANVDVIRDVIYYGYGCYPGPCDWRETLSDGVNDTFLYKEGEAPPLGGETIIQVGPPQTNPDGTRRHLYNLTLSSTSGKVSAQSLLPDEAVDPWCSTSVSYTPPTGTITGNVYQNEWGVCSDPEMDIPSGWVVECGNQIDGYYDAEQTGANSYQCKAADGTFDMPHSDYIIRFKAGTIPDGWEAITDCSQDSVHLDSDSGTADDLYLWQGLYAWFQTKEGDVHSGGRIVSKIPVATTYFSLDGSGGTPGVVSYNGSDPDFGKASLSTTDWLAKTSFSRKSYNYFYQLLGSPEEDYGGGLPTDTGIYYTGDPLAVDNWNVPNGQKIIVLVDNEVNINGNIDVALGGFLAIISSGKIKVAETVPQVEGVFITDKEFEVDSTGTDSDIEFRGEGMFIAESFDLGRDVGDLTETTPAESFVYRPDLIFNSPPEIWVSSYTWQELAP